MPATRPTTVQQRYEMVQRRATGASMGQIAAAMRLSKGVVCKWLGRAGAGEIGQLASVMGRPRCGPMGGYAAEVCAAVVRLKRENPGWGAERVARTLGADPALAGQRLPSASTIWRFWRRQAEPLVQTRRPACPPPPPVQAENERWQFDAVESITVEGLGVVTIAHARDSVGHCTMLSVAFLGPPGVRIVKLTFSQVQEAIRMGFAQWGLPDALQTDHASVFIDTDPQAFPTLFQLWLIALAIRHDLIPPHRPTANGNVERAHRTMKECTLAGHSFASLDELQRRLTQDWDEANSTAPSRAHTCDGQPPLVAHPALRQPRRCYSLADEADLFNLKRVDAFLARFTWLRTANANGVVSLGGQRYALGRAWAGHSVAVRFEPKDRSMLFTALPAAHNALNAHNAHNALTIASTNAAPSVSLPARGLDQVDIMGTPVIQPAFPLQMMLNLNFVPTSQRS